MKLVYISNVKMFIKPLAANAHKTGLPKNMKSAPRARAFTTSKPLRNPPSTKTYFKFINCSLI